MRPKTMVLFALALGCGSIAAVGINQVLANRHTTVITNTADMEPILVAMADVGMGDEVTAQLVKLENWPKDKIPPGAIVTLEAIEGRRARSKLFAGEPILEPKLLSKDAQSGSPADFIPKGFRVVSVKVDDVSAASSMLKPGDRVDVMVHLRANPGTGIDETQTRTILQDVKVFAVNEIYHRSNEADEQTIAARTISLLVTPSQAELVMLATELGSIRMVMRSIGDETVESTNGASHHDLLGTKSQGDRDSEEATGNELLDRLNGKKPETAAVGEIPAEQARVAAWRMLLIEAEKARELEFQHEEHLPTEKGEGAAVPGTEQPPVKASAEPEPLEEPTPSDADSEETASPEENNSDTTENVSNS